MKKVLALRSVGALAALAMAQSTIAVAQPAPARPAAPAPAAAAPRPAAPAAPPISHGAPIAGLCMMSIDQAIQTSTVGRFVGTRLDQLGGQVQAELQPEATAIQNEDKALEAARATLDAASYQSRAANLNLRITTFQRKQELRQRELTATEQKAINRIAQELDPIVRQIYQQKQCSILINRQAVMVGNPAMDITAAAVAALNAKITQFTFDRERLDTAPAAGAAAPR